MIPAADGKDYQNMHCGDRRATTVTFQLHVNRSNELLTLHSVVNEISPLFVNRFRRSKVVVCGKISPLHDDTTG